MIEGGRNNMGNQPAIPKYELYGLEFDSAFNRPELKVLGKRFLKATKGASTMNAQQFNNFIGLDFTQSSSRGKRPCRFFLCLVELLRLCCDSSDLLHSSGTFRIPP